MFAQGQPAMLSKLENEQGGYILHVFLFYCHNLASQEEHRRIRAPVKQTCDSTAYRYRVVATFYGI